MRRWSRSASTSACSSTACRYKSASRSALSRCLLRSGNGSLSGKANELGMAAASGPTEGARRMPAERDFRAMNGTKAYRAVYPSIKSDDVAGAAAARLLGNVRVQARIAEIMRAGAERAEVTVEQVVRELKLIGFSDIRKVVSWRNELVTRTEKGEDGEPVMVLMPRVTIVDADKISDEAAAAVAEVWQTVNGALRVKLHDKHAALVSIGKHLGMFVDHVHIQERNPP